MAALVTLCCCEKWHRQEQLPEGKGLLGLYFQVTVDHSDVWAEIKDELKAETMEEATC